jgi:hypothetical protein
MMQKEREKQRPLVRSCVMEEKSGQERGSLISARAGEPVSIGQLTVVPL